MSKLLGILAASTLLFVVSLPGSADAAQRAEGIENLGESELSAQYRRGYGRGYYGPRRAYGHRYYRARYYGRPYYRPRYYARPYYYRPYRAYYRPYYARPYWGTPFPFFFGY